MLDNPRLGEFSDSEGRVRAVHEGWDGVSGMGLNAVDPLLHPLEFRGLLRVGCLEPLEGVERLGDGEGFFG